MTNHGDLSPHSSAALYGKGVFTTISIRGGVPFLWEKHWGRLTRDAARVGVDTSAFDETSLQKNVSETLTAAGLIDGRARITFFDQGQPQLWAKDGGSATKLLIQTAHRRVIPESFRATLSPYVINSRSPLAGVKSCNYLEKILTLDEARLRGFDEAVMVNEHGLVASAVMANIFWLKDGVLNTPSFKTGCLAGMTREFVLENLDCREVEAEIAELYGADSIYLTSAGLGIVEVAVFEGRGLSNAPHPITQLIPKP